MTDESPDKQSEPEPDAAGSGESIGDQSVDALLDRASSLATEMATELGEASPEQRATQSEDSLDDLNDLAGHLDKELDQMEELTKQVGDQVGGGEPDDSISDDAAVPEAEESEAATSPAGEAEQTLSEAAAALDQTLSEELDSSADPAVGIGDDGTADAPASKSPEDTGVADGVEVPDYMMEFLEPDEPKTPPPEAPSVEDSAAAPEPSYDDDLTAPPVEPNPAPAVVPAAKATETSQTPADGKPHTGEGKAASVLAMASVLTRAPTSALCTFLDIADRPFGRVSPRVRALIGIVALATLGTSVAVFAISIL